MRRRTCSEKNLTTPTEGWGKTEKPTNRMIKHPPRHFFILVTVVIPGPGVWLWVGGSGGSLWEIVTYYVAILA